MMKKYATLTLILLVYATHLTAQINADSLAQSLDFEHISTKNAHKQPVHFLITRDTSGTAKPKPVIVFLQGSGAMPLLFYDEKGVSTILPFSIKTWRQKCHFVLIAKPGLPLAAPFEQAAAGLRDSTGKPPLAYMERDHLDGLVADADAVLHWLRKQPNVLRDSIYVMGHSQGYRVAAKLAATSKVPRKVACLSANPFNRYAEGIAKIRYRRDTEQVTHQASIAQMDSVFAASAYTAEICAQYPNTEKLPPEMRNSTSFARALSVDHLLAARMPVLVAYGTSDQGSMDNQLLPIIFNARGKHHLTLRAYPECDHNFFQTRRDANSQVLEPAYLWDQVADDVLKWLLE